MSTAVAPRLDDHVAVLAPTAADEGIASAILEQANVAAITVRTFDRLCAAIECGLGLAVLTEEAITPAGLVRLSRILEAQPPWSSMPLVVLTPPAAGARSASARPIASLPGVLLIERPVKIEGLLSAIRHGLDARSRQYAMRDLLDDARRAAEQRALLQRAAEESRAQAEAANRMKDEFLAVVSHELRTPLNAILGWAALMKRKALTEDQLQRAVESIERNSRLQAQLIEDLLDVSRVISGSLRLEIQPVDLTAVLEEAIATVTPASVTKGVQLRRMPAIGAAIVPGDPARLQQIIWNLLSNAIKFTPAGGAVDVTLQVAGTHVSLEVRDTGEGITSDFLPHVFERFRQADSTTTRQRGGLGLGLAIVRQLVELHGGSVRVASEGRGRGATFTVELPAIRAISLSGTHSHPRCEHSELGPERLVGKKILLVDDDSETLQVLATAFANSGAQVLAAGSAADALEAFQRNVPDAIVSDISMPREDGYSLIRKVRALDERHGSAPPAIALTAHARPEDREAAISAGFQVHLPKPVDPSELILRVALAIASAPH